MAAATRRSVHRRSNHRVVTADLLDSLLEVVSQLEVPRLLLLALEAENIRFSATDVVLRLKTRID